MNRLRWVLLGIIAIISLMGGFSIPHEGIHDTWWNRIPAFFALLGFGGCLLIIFFAKLLGKAFLQKREDYYDGD
jgi:uncharacterized membrane protein